MTDSNHERERVTLGIHKLHKSVKDPVVGSKWSACFDIHAWLHPFNSVRVISPQNNMQYITIGEDKTLTILGGWRAYVPTGLVFVIPWGHSVRVHARSGNAVNHGIVLANGEGIIDCDYTHEAFQPIINIADVPYTFHDGDRICQAEVLRDYHIDFEFHDNAPTQRADRKGGFGSSGR